MDLPHTLDYDLGVSIVADWSMNYFSDKEITAQQIKSHKKRNGKKKFLQCLQYDGATLIN